MARARRGTKPRPAGGRSSPKNRTPSPETSSAGTRPTLRRLAKWAGGIAGTALISTLVANLVTRGTESKPHDPKIPIAIRVIDNPKVIDIWSDDLLDMSVPTAAANDIPGDVAKNCDARLRDWAVGVGGADVEQTRFRVELQGLSDKAVLVSAASAHILSVAPAGARSTLECPSAGTANAVALSIDLDSRSPLARYEVQGNRRPFGFTVAKGETNIFEIEASTKRSELVSWRLRLDLNVDGKSQSIDILDRGKPFVTTTLQGQKPLQLR
jgi:hypothetical protein